PPGGCRYHRRHWRSPSVPAAPHAPALPPPSRWTNFPTGDRSWTKAKRTESSACCSALIWICTVPTRCRSSASPPASLNSPSAVAELPFCQKARQLPHRLPTVADGVLHLGIQL